MAITQNYSNIPNDYVWAWNWDWDWTDRSGNGNDGAAANVSYETAEVWLTAEQGIFNGSSSRVDVDWVLTQLWSTTTWTLSCWFKTSDVTPTTSAYRGFWDTNANTYLSFWLLTTWQYRAVFRVGWTFQFLLDTDAAPFSNNTWYNVIVTQDWVEPKIYINWVEEPSTFIISTYKTRWFNDAPWIDNARLWCYNANSAWNRNFLNGNISLVRYYDRVLSQAEMRNLYMEWIRHIWSRASYANLLQDCVSYFRAQDWWNTILYDLISQNTATYSSWTNTTDNLWNSKAISNPNYTWSSITYTTWYTFENSWWWWTIETSPTWLSATWINRTTTLRDIYLFWRTLSSAEVTTLENLCNRKYIYPYTREMTPNLMNGLQVWIWDSSWTDIMWNYSWTASNVTAIRRNQSKWGDYNWSNSYTNLWTWDIWIGWSFTLSCWVNPDTLSWYDNIFSDWLTWKSNFFLQSTHNDWILMAASWDWWSNWDGTYLRYTLSTSTWQHIVYTRSWTTKTLYINWVQQDTFTWWYSWWVTTNNKVFWSWNTLWTNVYDWQLYEPMIYDRALTAFEVQQLYYTNFLKFN